MKALGMVANIQPQFVPTDARWVEDFLPDQLMGCIYPWKTLTKAG
jgi:predicted amidohydrolase YtcJ